MISLRNSEVGCKYARSLGNSQSSDLDTTEPSSVNGFLQAHCNTP
jgi:hypothetical protein